MDSPTPTTPLNPAITSQPRQPRNRRRGGNRHRNQDISHLPTTSGRVFGGQLTRLQPEAPAFVPASVVPVPAVSHRKARPSQTQHRAATSVPPLQPPQQQQRRRRASLLGSTAPDIATRTHEDIGHGIYECAICTNEVNRNSKVWSCRTCWTVFHISCIKKWSKNDGSAVHQPNAEDVDGPPPGKQWRCPGCNLPKDVHPSAYTCWCEKELDPKVINGLPPHSCGQTCGRDRAFPRACPHPCDLLCHAGPCPPCTSMGPRQSCYCGKHAATKRCVETEYEAGWSCGAVCGDMMPCGEHSCPQPCHEGLCGACTAEVEARCYCGKVEKTIPCNTTEVGKDSHGWTGVFDCHQTCDNDMDCGIHKCQKECHPQDSSTPHCPRSPDVVDFCPCGKTRLAEMDIPPRSACTDPIPSCDKTCGKTLGCGHACTQVCHTDPCLPCLLTVSISCRCGRNAFNTICHQGTEEPPRCMRVCKATLNCGRHECGEHCCTGERKALERQATKRKLKPLGAMLRVLDNDVEPEHICTRLCGRKLKCGTHTCQDLCHRGPCGSCKEAIFDDVACNCGRTVLQAPLPCGTQSPPCTFPCHRPRACGHPQVAHNCHTDEEGCPKCPFLTEKKCLCSKKTLKNQPCWRVDVLCGLLCGQQLKCGYHFCRKTCHRPGECEDAQTPCQQECGKTKKTCGHPCEQPCHAPSACKEDKACPFKVIITCDCQRKKEEVRCNSRTSTREPVGRHTSLKCDEECTRLERNRTLAQALHISDEHTDDHVPYSTATLKMYLEDVAWAHKQEEILRLFAADEDEKRYRFPPMKGRQRSFIHSIAEDFGFDGESVDPEPHRHILLFKTPKFVAAPMKTLAQAARIKRAQLAISAPVSAVPATTAPERRLDETKIEYDGYLLTKPRFALTEDEIRPIVARAVPGTEFDIAFMSGEDAVALLPARSSGTPEQLTALLKTLQPALAAEITSHNLASALVLCKFDTTGFEPRILHQQERSDGVASNGWSQVAAKRAVPMQAPQVKAVGQRPVYTVLGSRLAEAKKKKVEGEEAHRKARAEPVVEDWEAEAEKDTELEGKETVEQGEGEGEGEVDEYATAAEE